MIVLSIICLCIFRFTVIKTNCNVQREVIDQLRCEDALIKRVEKGVVASAETEGWYHSILSEDCTAYGYAIDEAKAIRLGEEIFK